jgi:hypothetical protein
MITEITKDVYHAAVVAAWNKARKLAGKTTGGDCDPGYFYSVAGSTQFQRVCSFFDHPWPGYRSQVKPKTKVTHFMELICREACPKTETECLAKVGSHKDGFKYYRCTHLVGLCPWKEEAR